MDSMLICAVTILVLPVSILLRGFISKRVKRGLNFPPGSSGWPIVGETIHWALSGSQKFVNDKMKKCSPDVFQTSLMGERMAVFCGPHGNKFLFTNETKLLTSWYPQSLKKAFLFPEFVEDSMKEVTALKRSFIRDTLCPDALKQYIPTMDAMAREHIEKEWAPNGEVKAFYLSKKYTFDLACRLFMRVEDPTQIKKLSDTYHLATKGLFAFPIDLPGTAYNGAIKGGKMLREELLKIIRARRKELMESQNSAGLQDILSQMLLVTDENGQFVNDKVISNNIVGLLLASYDTTTNALTFVLKHLAELPHIYNEVLKVASTCVNGRTNGDRQEQRTHDLLAWEDIEKMKYSWNMVRESLRLTPPIHGTFREALTDFTYAGFTIPKGWKTFWSVHTTFKNPKYFPDPEKFDPSRFEGSGPAPYTFVPFGGGPRMCAGKEYARLEVLVFIHNIVTRFKLEKAIPNEKIVFHVSPIPVKGLPVRLQPHGKQS